jgi:epoxyqueuosine reductase QueG
LTGRLKSFIEDFVRRQVAGGGTQTGYRPVLVGYASADDPLWPELRELADANHALPAGMLTGARSVVTFFLPFERSVVKSNRGGRIPSPQWALAYRETNALINRILQGLPPALLENFGVRASSAPATWNFDPVTLSCTWSHKSACAIAGLGSFGLHHLLITDAGAAGRCGSLVVDAALEPTPRVAKERCEYFESGKCSYCVDACPAGAIRPSADAKLSLDKQACWAYIQSVSEDDCCGKCATGPCAFGSSVRRPRNAAV